MQEIWIDTEEIDEEKQNKIIRIGVPDEMIA